MNRNPIGIFDSGYGGLSVAKEIVRILPEYDYIYLGDNGRSPYGTRSFETVYQYTLECVKLLFRKGCRLVILACNTASAKALRTIQQKDLPLIAPENRVLGIIRPTAEVIGQYTKTGQVGVLATAGTVASQSYLLEIQKFYPQIAVYQEACPMWVPLVENNEYDRPGADYFVKQHIRNLLQKSPQIDVMLLACTHYPLLRHKITAAVPEPVTVLDQGKIVAESLSDYLRRHPEIEAACSKNSRYSFYTTDSAALFEQHAGIFFGRPVKAETLHLDA